MDTVLGSNPQGVSLGCAFPGCEETAEYIPPGQPVPAGSVGRKALFCRRHQAMNTLGAKTSAARKRKYEDVGRAIVSLGFQLFDELLDLPPDVTIRSINYDVLSDRLLLHLEGPGLPECQEGCIPERAEVAVHYDERSRLRRLEVQLPGK